MKDSKDHSEIAEFYKGRNVLITGASGLMGKVLIWKILYSCPDVNSIFVLIRPKRGKSVESRLDEMLKVPIFNSFMKENPSILKKIVAISGDVANTDLDLSPENRKKLVNEVSIVFHVAATLKLDANLKDAVNMNTEGTYRLLQLSLEMKNLVAFVHTSTAFCHCDVPIMEERVYSPPEDPENLMNLVRWMDRDLLHSITDQLISPHPNTYTYSKRLAERLVADYYPKLPVAIARPSIVIPGWAEPLPGWVDNLNGPVGIMIGAGKGVIRTMLCNPEYNAEVIPVDFAINGLLAIAWDVGKRKERVGEIPVFNLTQGDENPKTWGEIVEQGKEMAYKYPFEMTLWYPGGSIRKNRLIHAICVILFHWIPAYFIDFIMMLIGQKKFMVRVQQKIHDGLRVLQYFTLHQWKFDNTKVKNLRASMNDVDREKFTLDFKAVKPDLYMVDCILGARKYCLKEDPKSIPKCRRNLKILYVLDRLVVIMFYLTLAWLSLYFIQKFVSVYTNKEYNMQPVDT